ncbi:MAG: hypothetical protein J5726_03805 [Treponema sp.]|nr:hypothetical protein [Treponema sp.]
MSDILIVGKDLPDCLDFAEAFVTTRKVYCVCRDESEAADFESEGIYASTWNRSSAISSRSLIIKAETHLEELNQIVLFFDSYYFGTRFELDRTEDVSAAVDTMIASFQYFVNELLLRLEQRKDPVSVVFLAKTYPSKAENLRSGNKNVNIHPTSNIVNCAQQAFIALAENFATLVGDKQYLSVLLAKCEQSNELYNSDKQLAAWVKESLNQLESFKSPQNVKQACSWIRAGGKVSNGFSLFK